MLFKVICLRLRGAFALATLMLSHMITVFWLSNQSLTTLFTGKSSFVMSSSFMKSKVYVLCKTFVALIAEESNHPIRILPTNWSTGLIFKVHSHLKHQFHFMQSNWYWSLIQGLNSSNLQQNCWGPEVQDHHSLTATSGPPSPWARSEALR